MELFTMGADPEFFLSDGTNYVAGIPYVKGTKHEPQMLPNGSNLQRDNVAVEVGVKVAKSAEEFAKNVLTAIHDMTTVLPDNLEVHIIPSTNFPRKELRWDEAKEFGCDPDFDAWRDGEENHIDNTCAERSTFRSCGGHLHIGYIKGSGLEFLLDDKGKREVIKAHDLNHGIYATIVDNSQAAIDRRKLYGKAGCYRPTVYGVEYRTLSNFWCQSPNHIMLMHKLTAEALFMVKDNKLTGLLDRVGRIKLQDIINKGDKGAAEEILYNKLYDNYGPDTLDILDRVL
jgi:hypothetical protein